MSEEFLNDPYNPQVPPLESETIPLDEIIRRAIDGTLYDLHTWLPATITDVDDDGFVDIQPNLKRVYNDGKVVSLPIIQRVMVCQPRGADYYLKLPVAVGDTGIALFCERSIDAWSVSGGIIDPLDGRRHDLSDAIFIPGIFPESQPVPNASNDDLVMNNSGATVTLKKAGKFLFSSLDDELMEILSQLSDACSQISNSGGPTFNAAVFAALKVRIDALKG